MPAILPQDNYAAWLNPANSDRTSLLSMLRPYPAGELEMYAVSPKVNSLKNNSPDLITSI